MRARSLGHLLARGLSALARRREGAAAVEFAIVVPVLGVILAGTMDLAQLANEAAVLDVAVRAGMDYALADSTNTTGITSAIAGFRSSWAGNTPTVTFPNAEAGYSPWFCTCDGDAISGGGTVTCNNDTTDGGVLCGSGPKHIYVSIKATESGIKWLLPFTAAALPSSSGCASGSVCRTLTVRVE